MKATRLLEIGIKPRDIRVCRWCPAAFARQYGTEEPLRHQLDRHGYVGERPRWARGALRGALRG